MAMLTIAEAADNYVSVCRAVTHARKKCELARTELTMSEKYFDDAVAEVEVSKKRLFSILEHEVRRGEVK